MLFVDHAVVELSKFGVVPAVGSAYEVAGDTLQLVDVRASAFGAFLKTVCGVFVAAVHAAVAVVVHGAITDVVFVHEVYNVGHCFGIVCGVTVNLHVEYMASACEGMIGSLHLSFVLGRTVIVDGNVVGVGGVDLVGNPGNHTEAFAIAHGEFS